jgi:hypothetical protein
LFTEKLDEPTNSKLTEVATVNVDDLAELSPDLIINLHQETLEGDLDVMLTIIEDIHSQNDSLANALAVLVKSFHFQELLDLLEPLINHN